MAIKLNVNSYVTLDEANAYFIDRSDSDKWHLLNNNDKEEYITTATRYLDDAVTYVGVAVSTSQPLAWPREGSYFDDKFNDTVSFKDPDRPDRLQKATFEMAMHLIENPGVLNSTTTVDNISVSSIKLSGIQNPSRLPHIVRKALGNLAEFGGNTPWRAW
jgi:hypothetical protein